MDAAPFATGLAAAGFVAGFTGVFACVDLTDDFKAGGFNATFVTGLAELFFDAAALLEAFAGDALLPALGTFVAIALPNSPYNKRAYGKCYCAARSKFPLSRAPLSSYSLMFDCLNKIRFIAVVFPSRPNLILQRLKPCKRFL